MSAATLRAAAEHLAQLAAELDAFAPIDHTGGIVWGVTAVPDPRNPDEAIAEQVRLADTSPEVAAFIVAMHRVVGPLSFLLFRAATIEARVNVSPERAEVAQALEVAAAILRGVE